MSEKDCLDCIYSGPCDTPKAATVCKYPVPGWIAMRAPGGNFLSGIEARQCPLFKTVEMVEQEKEEARQNDQPRPPTG